MKTYIFVRNKKYRPSTYYRISQYINENASNSIDVIEYELNGFYNNKSKSKFKSVLKGMFYSFIPGYTRRLISLMRIHKNKGIYNVFIQRECFPKVVGPVGKILFKKMLKDANEVYWDFDDNIFKSDEITKFEKELLVKYARQITVGNEYLSNLELLKKNKNIIIVNTTDKMMEQVNVEKINEVRKKSFDKEIVLVWIGTKHNLIHLENIIPELDRSTLLKNGKSVKLKVVCDAELNVPTKKLEIINIKWNRDIAFNEMLTSHIGLMPLIENEFTKGKCAFKAVQAIGAGLPVIVSNVGMNKEVVSNNNGFLVNDITEWGKSVFEISNNFKEWEQRSLNSRELWEMNFNSKENQKIIMKILGGEGIN